MLRIQKNIFARVYRFTFSNRGTASFTSKRDDSFVNDADKPYVIGTATLPFNP